MTTSLRIGPDLILPLDAVTQTFGILAVRGAGKSNLGAVMAEEMFAAGLPFVAVDPVGSWWGLRAEGDGPGSRAGLSIPIFGGRHGDVPLERTGGAMLADLIVETRLSCVLDISEFSEGDKIRFLIDFAERLYRKNTEPLHLFLEEADDYVPQRPFREQARLLGAWENVVRRGRARGLGITMITQRSASLNKNVLTQIETLFVLRTTSPQDRKAIAGWVDYHGQGKELLDSLPELKSGEAWIWSPQYLGKLERVHVRRRATLDSGATPKGAVTARKVSTLADVDLGAVRTRMAATIEKAKADDPRELRKEIAELKRQLSMKLPPVAAVRERVEVPVFTPEALAEMQEMRSELEAIRVGFELLTRHVELVKSSAALTQSVQISTPAPTGRRLLSGAGGVQRPTPASNSGQGAAKLGRGEKQMLRALTKNHPEATVDRKAALMSGYSLRSSTFRNILSSLRSQGFITGSRDGLQLTAAGLEALGAYDPLPTGTELHDYWLKWVGFDSVPGRVLRVLIEQYPTQFLRDGLAHAASTSPDSSTYRNALSTLRSLELIEGKGELRASKELFE